MESATATHAGHGHHHGEPTVSPARLPDPAEPVPEVAWPTLALFIAALAGTIASSAAALSGTIPYPVAIVANAVCFYMFFTVLHDACHRSFSKRPALNDWFGRISGPFLSPVASYSVFRYVHMQHHRFTNHDDGADPDHYASSGPAWQMPFRWLTIDLVSYLPFYLKAIGGRPRKDKIELAVTVTIVLGSAIACFATGYGAEWLLLYLLPSRMSLMFLAWAFDYLPHHELESKPQENKYRTTRIRAGNEKVWSPVLLYQNYHLVHHMHPLIPFYRYVKAWRKNEDHYLEEHPPLTTIGGRSLTQEEFKEIRKSA